MPWSRRSSRLLASFRRCSSSRRRGKAGPLQLGQPISVQVQMSPTKQSASEKIYKDANFLSFADFEAAFEEWKQLFQHPFRVASSEKHEDRELADRFKYRYVVYHCSRYGEPRKRGAGRRPHQNYLPCGCNAKLRLNFHAANLGSLCVTTLVTEHNHEPISEEGCLGLVGPMAKRRKSSPGEGDSPEEHSPNSTASSSFAGPGGGDPFSPLSLQPGLHHSPSSGGQSSSEGANGGGLALVSPLQVHRKLGHSPVQKGVASQGGLVSPLAKSGLAAYLAKNQRQGPSSSASSRCHQTPLPSVDQKRLLPPPLPMTSQQHSALGDFLRRQQQQQQEHQQQQQQQQSSPLLPLFQELLRQGQQGPAEGRAVEAPQSLLGLLSPHQPRQQQQLGGAVPCTPSTSSILSAALYRQMQQQMPSSTSSAQPQPNNKSSALALLQLQLLLNSSNKTPTPAPHPQQGLGHVQLLQFLGQMQQNFAGLQQQQPRAPVPVQHHFGGGNDQLEAMMGRTEIIQEADLLLQMLVGQMIRTRDLAIYLRRLRQFLAENCD